MKTQLKSNIQGRIVRHSHRNTAHRAFSGGMVIMFMTLLYGCGESSILTANFDEYNEGTFVSGSIPGPPDGDVTTNVVAEVFVTSDGTSLMEGNKLLVSNNAQVDFRPAEHTVPDSYQIVWRGVRDNTSSGRTNIRFMDLGENRAMVLRFEDNRLIVRTGDQNPEPNFSTDRVHDVSITINTSGPNPVTVNVTEDGNSLFNSPSLDLLDTDFSSLHTVRIESESNYFVQDLVVIPN